MTLIPQLEQHSRKSSFREKLIEHLFISELLKLSWLEGGCSLEIAKPEVDNQGYDLIAEQNKVIRHIQLKAAHREAKTAKQTVHSALFSKPSGCVVWVYFDEKTLELGPFLFFGDTAGLPLSSIEGFKVAKHTKADTKGVKSERPQIREIKKIKFDKYETVREIYKLLFEPVAASCYVAYDSKSPSAKLSVESDNSQEGFPKILRIEQWSKHPEQKNYKIIRAYLDLENMNGSVQLNDFRRHCSDNGISKFNAHYASMKTDKGNSHGRIFYDKNGEVYIWPRVREEIEKFF